MSRKFTKSITALVAAFALLLSLFSASALAQYPSAIPNPAGDDVPTEDLLGTIDIQQTQIPAVTDVTPNPDGTVTVVLDLGELNENRRLIDRMVVSYNPVIYDGPIRPLLSIKIPPCVTPIKVELFFKAGGTSVKYVDIPVDGCVNGVAAIPVPGGNAQLAFTGNEVSVPAAAGAALIGAGGLFLLAANKRSRKES